MPVKAVRKPFEIYILFACLAFQAISALFGGILLVSDPTGTLIQMPLSILKNSPFHDFLIPGLVLLLLLGVYPAFISYGLITGKTIRGPEALNIYKNQHWTWGASLYLGIMLILWINVEVMFVGYGHFIQSFYSFWGVIILVLALLPRVNEYLSKETVQLEVLNVSQVESETV